jgi:hypothetical protein
MSTAKYSLKGIAFLRRFVLVEMEEGIDVERSTEIRIDVRRYIQTRYLKSVKTRAIFHYSIWDGHEGSHLSRL